MHYIGRDRETKKNKRRKAAMTKATVTQHVQHEQQQVQLGAEPARTG